MPRILREVRLRQNRRTDDDFGGRMSMRHTGMSPVVEAWSTCRTSSAQDWPPQRLLQAKGQTTVSVVIPALNEEATVGTIVTAIRSAFVQSVPCGRVTGRLRSVDLALALWAVRAFVVSQTTSPRACRRVRQGDASRAGRAQVTSSRSSIPTSTRSIRGSSADSWGHADRPVSLLRASPRTSDRRFTPIPTAATRREPRPASAQPLLA